MRLRTQLLVATVVLIATLTGAALFVIQRTVTAEVRRQVASSLSASVAAFQGVQRDREQHLSRTAALLSELPTLKALMATQDPSTVQDGSLPFWKLAGSDLFVLAAPDGKLLALHMAEPKWTSTTVSRHVVQSLESGETSGWWFEQGKLYWVFLRPLTAGENASARDLGVIAVGYEIDHNIATELARVSRGDIALAAGSQIIASTLPQAAADKLQQQVTFGGADGGDVVLDGEHYSTGSIALREANPSVRCHVLVPIAPARAFLSRLNRTLVLLGIAAMGFGAVLFVLIAGAITRPLDNLVAAVRAFARGDERYRVNARGSLEVEQLAEAFSVMRGQLHELQRQRIAHARVAALARTASSISHDLRHYLSAVVANAEFLRDAPNSGGEREEIYGEIQSASDHMVEMIDSMRELGREERVLTPAAANMVEVARRAIDAVTARHDLRTCRIALTSSGEMNGSFEARKIERALFNLVLNACEATAGRPGRVTVNISGTRDEFIISVEDNGPGIPEALRTNLFEPFVSSGKENGTGLGLAIVSKIVEDHGGAVAVERTSAEGTVFTVVLPRFAQPATADAPATATHGSL